jgi:hypothetical protein
MKPGTKVALVGLGAFIIYNEIQKRNNCPKVFYVDYIPGGYNGCILPPFGVLINKAQRGNERLLHHEMIHWQQYQREGLLPFAFNYWSEHFKVGYDLNPYEIEARLKSGEFDCCIENYTDCVRSGISNTVFNPSFKKCT